MVGEQDGLKGAEIQRYQVVNGVNYAWKPEGFNWDLS